MKYIFVSVFLLLSGCSFTSFEKENEANSTTNFAYITKQLASHNICSKINNNTVLYLTDFVNETNLDNRSELGFLLSNQLKVNILKNDCAKNVSIKTFNLGQNLKIGQNGSKILTRDLKNLKTQSLEDDKQIAIGTYAITSNQLILFLKLVDLEESNTIASSSTTTKVTNEILELEGLDMEQEQPYIQTPFHL